MTEGSWTHEHTSKFFHPAPRLFRALTDPAELERWFAERARVDPRAGGQFQFWGRHTLGAPAEPAADQVLTEFDAGQRLGFRWSVLGVATEVTITLDAGETATAPAASPGESVVRLALEHRISAPLPTTRARDLVDDWWRLCFGNLAAHLEGVAVVRPDFTDPSPEIRVSIAIDAPPEAVFQALIEPSLLNQWIATDAAVEPRVGGRYELGWTYPMGDKEVNGGPTTILAVVPGRQLVVDWPDWRGNPEVPIQTVTWILDATGSGTRATLVHSGFTRAADVSDYPFGWGYFLTQLKQAVVRSIAGSR